MVLYVWVFGARKYQANKVRFGCVVCFTCNGHEELLLLVSFFLFVSCLALNEIIDDDDGHFYY